MEDALLEVDETTIATIRRQMAHDDQCGRLDGDDAPTRVVLNLLHDGEHSDIDLIEGDMSEERFQGFVRLAVEVVPGRLKSRIAAVTRYDVVAIHLSYEEDPRGPLPAPDPYRAEHLATLRRTLRSLTPHRWAIDRVRRQPVTPLAARRGRTRAPRQRSSRTGARSATRAGPGGDDGADPPGDHEPPAGGDALTERLDSLVADLGGQSLRLARAFGRLEHEVATLRARIRELERDRDAA